jgi:hypothetical protein
MERMDKFRAVRTPAGRSAAAAKAIPGLMEKRAAVAAVWRRRAPALSEVVAMFKLSDKRPAGTARAT